MRAKISIVFLSILVLVSFGFSSNQAFAVGHNIPTEPESCADCDALEQEFIEQCLSNDIEAQVVSLFCEELALILETCRPLFCPVGGTFEGVDTTSLIVAGAQMNASWMIPVIVSAIGIGIVLVRSFRNSVK